MRVKLSKNKMMPLLFSANLLFMGCGSYLASAIYGGNAWAQSPSASESDAELKGPHGGKLIKQGKLSLEVTVFERGVPPEMRLYGYYEGKLIAPDMLDVTIVLDRLGGKQDMLSFSPEGDYLVSNQTVVEPHSFVVNIKASYQGEAVQWRYDNFEGRTQVSDRLLALSKVKVEPAKAMQLNFTDTLYGTIAPVKSQVFSVNAAYNGIIEQLYVGVGDSVTKGQTIAKVRNAKSLQSFNVLAPATGQIIEQRLNLGDNTSTGAIVEIADLSSVWVNLSAFPNNMEKLAVGQAVTIIDNHDELKSQGELSYISPMMTGGHIARVRAVIANPDGHWRPGMHIKAKIQTRNKQVPLAVKTSALQSFRDNPVVFAKFGNTFEVRMLELGESNGEYIEVLSGLDAGTEYVTANSFLFKADVLKDAAKHDH